MSYKPFEAVLMRPWKGQIHFCGEFRGNDFLVKGDFEPTVHLEHVGALTCLRLGASDAAVDEIEIVKSAIAKFLASENLQKYHAGATVKRSVLSEGRERPNELTIAFVSAKDQKVNNRFKK